MRRFFSLTISVLLIISICTSMISCEKNRKYDADEVIGAARVLIEKSIPLNELLYGKGLAYTDEGVGIYKRADKSSLDAFGISDLDQVKEMIKEIYSDSYSKTIFNSDTFSSIKIDDVVKSYNRYYQEYDDYGNPTYIMVNSKYEYFLKGSYEYQESMEVVGVKGEVITVRALVTVTGENSKVKNINLDIRLIEQENGWRLESPTYAVYNEYTDLYDELNKK
jgi:hypothetical protein